MTRWQPVSQQRWQEPLSIARQHVGQPMALLYSARPEHYTGQHSFLLLEPVACHTGNRWAALPPLPEGEDDGLPYYVGYLGYGMRNDAETLARGTPSLLDMPDFMLLAYARLLHFDHEARTVHEYRRAGLTPLPAAPATGSAPAHVSTLASNFSRHSYEQCIRDTLAQIADGRFYQANITRKFHGRFSAAPDALALYEKLCAISPAPFSAFIQHGELAILSSSPESFLSIEGGRITSRPIKGSAARGADEATDRALREALTSSEKNHAENLMITDLMRHDLSRVSLPGSVKVAEQSALYSYPTIHHLISTITAKQAAGSTSYDVVKACFPPGSMTGAPKIAAMQWCTAQERQERGVYSGALGWFGAGGRAELSVVIRTLLVAGEQFEFQVGGGIVADSTPEDEWRETLVKARGIAQALGITEQQLEAL